MMIEQLKDTGTVFIQSAPISFWESIAFIIGITHDIGKATTYFQRYLTASDQEKKTLKNEATTHHSLLSALYTYRITEIYCQVYKEMYSGTLIDFIPFFTFWAVKKHHGSLENPLFKELSSPQFDALPSQLKAIHSPTITNHLTYCSQELHITLPNVLFPEPLETWIQSTFKNQLNRNSIRYKLQKTYPSNNTEGYFLMSYFYSLLVYADKYSVIFSGKKKRYNTIHSKNVDTYRNLNFKKPKNNIDKIRSAVYQKATYYTSQINLSKNKILSLNIPTGTGKTLTGLASALILRDRIVREECYLPRIIYALPFTSIIDQNFHVFQDVFNTSSSHILLKHHSMADIFFKNETNDSNYDINESRFLIESWDSEIVVTTFVQVFHTLLTNSNQALKKFHKLAGSILILDEVQSLPLKYWNLVSMLLKELTHHFNTRILLMTATQPKLFDSGDIVELIPDKEKYFKQLNRVTLEFYPEKITMDDLAKNLIHNLKTTQKSYLVILNTIKSSLELYQKIEETLPDLHMEYLSTNIVPIDRRERIQKIRNDPTIRLVISTQLIEAGVDIDLDEVWRDFGPLDAINQAAGRCNRHNTKNQKGYVKIFMLCDEKESLIYRHIYGDNPLSILLTKGVYQNQHKIEENNFFSLINAYYQGLNQGKYSYINDQYLKDIYTLDYSKIGKFTLIEDTEYYKGDIFIAIDKKADRLWQQFREISFIPDPFEKANRFYEIKKDLYDYVISIPYAYLDTKHRGLHYLPFEQVETYYDSKTGFKREKKFIEKEETILF